MTVNLNWGPSGCVQFVEVEGVSEPRVAACMIDAFRNAPLPRFTDSAVRARSPSSVEEEFSRIGRLAPVVIQRVVRSHYGQLRKCYEQGLGRDRNLRGRVSARFVIPESGLVSSVANAGSDLPDAEVVNCILRSFAGMRFPSPAGGSVVVVYPIMLAPW